VFAEVIRLAATIAETLLGTVAPAFVILGEIAAPILNAVAAILGFLNDVLDIAAVKWAIVISLVMALAITAIPSLISAIGALIVGMKAAIVQMAIWIAKKIAMLALSGPWGWAPLATAAALTAGMVAAFAKLAGGGSSNQGLPEREKPWLRFLGQSTRR